MLHLLVFHLSCFWEAFLFAKRLLPHVVVVACSCTCEKFYITLVG